MLSPDTSNDVPSKQELQSLATFQSRVVKHLSAVMLTLLAAAALQLRDEGSADRVVQMFSGSDATRPDTSLPSSVLAAKVALPAAEVAVQVETQPKRYQRLTVTAEYAPDAEFIVQFYDAEQKEAGRGFARDGRFRMVRDFERHMLPKYLVVLTREGQKVGQTTLY
ncbi:hypothetical protein COW46_00020 [Candidatus Gracilibacteria bacterium CG17_big_fil_post_rev_8_21_14_2_50_48_13]|nr:MAG: hypothetical protein COW46_00020 [Candidatus Gracilibacteria bacterium CG17_big_fil_post_rev_8_21_14_2_50_48_13]